MQHARIFAETLTSEAFAPFGTVIAPLDTPGRMPLDGAVANLRDDAKPILGVTRLSSLPGPIVIDQIERHPCSTQTFLPIGLSSILVVVAKSGDAPTKPAHFKAFIAQGQGISYLPGIWHSGIRSLSAFSDLVTLIWKSGDWRDEEHVRLKKHIGIEFLENN